MGYSKILHYYMGESLVWPMHPVHNKIKTPLLAGIRGRAAHPPDRLDEGDPGQEEVAQVVPCYQCYEEDQESVSRVFRVVF